jgi:hypothetical protein
MPAIGASCKTLAPARAVDAKGPPMNKTITDGVNFLPPEFADGLDVWSSGDGTPGSSTYENDPNAAFVLADQDFGGCLELVKTTATQKLRFTGQTVMLPGCYLRIRARVKAISGNMPGIRIAGWAGDGTNAHVPGLVETGPSLTLTEYGRVVEVSAIVGTGNRPGVDMVWGMGPSYGHFGLDLIGATGGVVRIDDIVIEDITNAFHRELMDWVDIRDYGAVGDGVTDDADAFEQADMSAAGREVLVPDGQYFLGRHVSLLNPVRFEGTVTMPADQRLVLRGSFELNSYVEAFGDEVLGFKKAYQALLNFTDHESLDMCGRRIELDAPIDMFAAEGTKTQFEVRRVIRNGQFNAIAGPDWATDVATRTASYSAANPLELTGISGAANIAVGALVTGVGVGREVYVRAVDPVAGRVTLNVPLYGAGATQSYNFTRFKYILDFSGYTKFSKVTFDSVEFLCNGIASGILLAPDGQTFHLRDCFVTKPADRGVTSPGRGCQDLQIDRCHFVSDEQALPVTSRNSVAFNVNANDAKIRDNRFERFGHTGILHGSGHLIVGNHWFQGDDLQGSPRMGGMIFTQENVKSVITGNYIDNCSIEWTNEHDEAPDFDVEFSFGGLSVTGNIFTMSNAADWSRWLVIRPFGTGHFVHGLSVTGNTFKALNGNIERIEEVNSSIADLDYGRMRNVEFSGNSFNGVDQITINPVTLEFAQTASASTWVLDPSGYLPFDGWARNVTSVVPEGPITTQSGAKIYDNPYVTVNSGLDADQVKLNWSASCVGKVVVTTRMDNPF